jgi:GntR family transcriptional regulator
VRVTIERVDLAQLGPFVRDDAFPLHDQIEQWVTAEIIAGRLRAGDCLPNERDLSSNLHVSRMTLRQALSMLEQRGAIYRMNGRGGGTFIAEPRVDLDLSGIAGLTRLVADARRRTSSTVIDAVRRPATLMEASRLELTSSAMVYFVSRIRLLDDIPLAVERSCFPAEVLPGFLDRDLSGSIYSVLDSYGCRPIAADEYLDATAVDSDDALRLAVAPGSAVLRIERLARDGHNRAIELGFDLLRSDRMRVSVHSGLRR